MTFDRDNSLEIFVVDAFASSIFKGNPAAVCLPEDRLPDGICQSIAAEMNLSETAFIHSVERKADDIPRFGLRWFTPKVQVDLCGHATLATAKVIFSEIGVDSEVLAFDTSSGPLFAHRNGTAIRIDLPLNRSEPTSPPNGLLGALGNPVPKNIDYCRENRKLLVELEDEDAVSALEPDFAALKALKSPPLIMGVIVTAKGGGSGDPDFVSRFFAPRYGVDEDPVSGAAHTVLGPYWMERLGKTKMKAHQISARGGDITVRVQDDRVHLEGEAVIVIEGRMRLA